LSEVRAVLLDALGTLVERTLARPDRVGRFVRKVAVSAQLVGGGSWRRTLTLREPAAEIDRLRIALGPKLAELPAPVTLAAIKADPAFAELALVRQGRLSVVPVPEPLWKRLLKMAGR